MALRTPNEAPRRPVQKIPSRPTRCARPNAWCELVRSKPCANQLVSVWPDLGTRTATKSSRLARSTCLLRISGTPRSLISRSLFKKWLRALRLRRRPTTRFCCSSRCAFSRDSSPENASDCSNCPLPTTVKLFVLQRLHLLHPPLHLHRSVPPPPLRFLFSLLPTQLPQPQTSSTRSLPPALDPTLSRRQLPPHQLHLTRCPPSNCCGLRPLSTDGGRERSESATALCHRLPRRQRARDRATRSGNLAAAPSEWTPESTSVSTLEGAPGVAGQVADHPATTLTLALEIDPHASPD